MKRTNSHADTDSSAHNTRRVRARVLAPVPDPVTLFPLSELLPELRTNVIYPMLSYRALWMLSQTCRAFNTELMRPDGVGALWIPGQWRNVVGNAPYWFPLMESSREFRVNIKDTLRSLVPALANLLYAPWESIILEVHHENLFALLVRNKQRMRMYVSSDQPTGFSVDTTVGTDGTIRAVKDTMGTFGAMANMAYSLRTPSVLLRRHGISETLVDTFYTAKRAYAECREVLSDTVQRLKFILAHVRSDRLHCNGDAPVVSELANDIKTAQDAQATVVKLRTELKEAIRSSSGVSSFACAPLITK